MEDNENGAEGRAAVLMEPMSKSDLMHSHTIHVLVEVDPRKEPVRLEFDMNQVTGRVLKERAGVPLDNDLARRRDQKLELVTNDETITIANGDRFVSLPPGTIS